MPGLPFAVGGPSRNVNGLPASLRASIELEKVPSSPQSSIKEFSRDTGSRSPAGFGTPIGNATDDAVLNMTRSPEGRLEALVAFNKVNRDDQSCRKPPQFRLAV